MDGLRIGDLRRRDNAGDIEVALARLRRPDANALVRQHGMQRVLVRLGVDRNGRDAHFTAGANDAYRDFAAVGDENSSYHACAYAVIAAKQGLAIFHGIAVLHENPHDNARGLGSHFISNLHRFHDADGLVLAHLVARQYKGRFAGAELW